MATGFTEVTRMLLMQGDAGDQVAEILGRALTRLSAEVETLGNAVEALQAKQSASLP
jgi:hypothetical protein